MISNRLWAFILPLLFIHCVRPEPTNQDESDNTDPLKLLWQRTNQESYNWGAYAPPLILGDSLLLTAGDGAIRCTSIDSGKTIWSSSYANIGFMNKRFVIDQTHLYGFYGREEVFAVKLSDGTQAWSALIDSNREFGYADDIDASHYYVGVNSYGNIRRIMKFDKFTGELQDTLRIDKMPWSLAYDSGSLYCNNGMSSGANSLGRIICYEANTLDSSWGYYSIGGTFSVCPSVVNDGVLYAGTVWGGSLGNEIVALNAETGARLWRTSTTGCYQIVIHDEVLYYAGGSSVNALDKNTGHVLWEAIIPTTDESSPLAYWDGYVYKAHGGTLFVFDAETGERVYYTYTFDGKAEYVYQVSAGAGKIFVQTSQHLYALEPFNPDALSPDHTASKL
ncbi:MAG: PQQ-binding-like beta-propeller repeat protein [Candidatus Marinimicrobia bacterium]|nr:PQQ-binding-like beta-propeller repeat protein [Candidatus Neomarinimicrobiota bacterium]MCF7839814.1 PQQ-binding-like beta-propeller repeat protein [Candidatus Neomarinimicrobiota bacterium]MCF7901848.1 PQQ-binding-like beta-propeller repeat protein [Candidatus Neomarinimicrobiota bacterium]